MKIHKLLFLFVALALISCKDEDPMPEGQPGQVNPSLIGTWTLTDLNSMNGLFSQTGGMLDIDGTFVMTGMLLNGLLEIEEDNTYSSNGTLQVNTTITVDGSEFPGGPTTTTFLGNGTWSKDGDDLVLMNGETKNCIIVTLTDTNLELDYPFESEEDNAGIVSTLSGTLRYGFTR